MQIGLIVQELNGLGPIHHDLLGINASLEKRGYPVTIFTSSGEASFAGEVLHYRDAEIFLNDQEDIAIYFSSGHDPAGLATLGRLNCSVFVRCCDPIPACVVSRWSSTVGRECKLIYEHIACLANMKVNAFFTDSLSSGEVLKRLGVQSAQIYVAPRFGRCSDLLCLPDEVSTLDTLRPRCFNVLTVGQLAPSENYELMMESFSKAVVTADLDIHLHHIGPHDPSFQTYTNEVVDVLVRNNMMHRFTFYGDVGKRALATFYRNCDLYWTTASHDGSSPSAIEAMAFGLPVLSNRNSSHSETFGTAAVFGDTIEDLSGQLKNILGDDTYRLLLGHRSRERYENLFVPSALNRQFLSAFDAAISGSVKNVNALDVDRGGNWFNLPKANEFLSFALRNTSPMSTFGLIGQARRMALVDQALRNTAADGDLQTYFASPDFLDYAKDIVLPQAGSHLRPTLRLIWNFNRLVKLRFDLTRAESVSAFLEWFDREGAKAYENLEQAMMLKLN